MNTVSTVSPPPVISLLSESVVEEIRHACCTWGAFVLTDHGLEKELLDQVVQTGHAFFDLPTSTKLKYNLQNNGSKWRGYMPFGGERSCKGMIQDDKEGLYLGDEHDDNHHPNKGLPTFGSNVYPNDEIPHMKDLYNDYHQQMKELGDCIMKLLAEGLGLPEDYIVDRITQHDPIILPRVFRYPPQKKKKKRQPTTNLQEDEQLKDDGETTSTSMNMGIGRHSDYGLWTMILTDAPGLEFCHPLHHTWHPIPFIPHAIIMNVGDVLDRLSAGRLVSAYHRVINPSTTKTRLSLPFFYDPSWTARMEILPLSDLTSCTATEKSNSNNNRNKDVYDTPERALRWSMTKITCSFDQSPGVEYSEFLSKKVAKVFPSIIPESAWRNLRSTSEPSTRHALVVEDPNYLSTIQQDDCIS